MKFNRKTVHKLFTTGVQIGSFVAPCPVRAITLVHDTFHNDEILTISRDDVEGMTQHQLKAMLAKIKAAYDGPMCMKIQTFGVSHNPIVEID